MTGTRGAELDVDWLQSEAGLRRVRCACTFSTQYAILLLLLLLLLALLQRCYKLTAYPVVIDCRRLDLS